MNDVHRLDAEAVQRCRAGQTAAFGELVDRYHRQIFALAWRMTGSRDAAEEITQIVFVKAFEHLHSFDVNRRFFSWLYRIGINESLTWKHTMLPHDDITTQTATDPGPDAVLLEKERISGVQKAVMRLKPDHREVIVLRHFRELSYAGIAEVLGIPEKTVKSRLFTARAALAAFLREGGVI